MQNIIKQLKNDSYVKKIL